MKSVALVAAALLLTLQLSHGKLPAPSVNSPIQTKNNGEHRHRRRFANFHQQSAVNVVASMPAAKPALAKSLGDPWYFNLVPIHRKELAKFLSLSMMMFWIVFIFTMTRDTKDALIVTTCGSEAIAFLKVYGVVPAAAAFMLGYAKMANVMSPRSLFYATLAPFVVFYLVFAFVLYPLKDYLHPLSIVVPKGGMSFAVNLVRHWTFSLYYIVSELWGSAGIPLLFWSCANDVVKLDQV
jgi:ATP/ADP translocase